ncbi:hypothetical protein ACWEKT_03100 [Nocardia takedensis]
MTPTSAARAVERIDASRAMVEDAAVTLSADRVPVASFVAGGPNGKVDPGLLATQELLRKIREQQEREEKQEKKNTAPGGTNQPPPPATGNTPPVDPKPTPVPAQATPAPAQVTPSQPQNKPAPAQTTPVDQSTPKSESPAIPGQPESPSSTADLTELARKYPYLYGNLVPPNGAEMPGVNVEVRSSPWPVDLNRPIPSNSVPVDGSNATRTDLPLNGLLWPVDPKPGAPKSVTVGAEMEVTTPSLTGTGVLAMGSTTDGTALQWVPATVPAAGDWALLVGGVGLRTVATGGGTAALLTGGGAAVGTGAGAATGAGAMTAGGIMTAGTTTAGTIGATGIGVPIAAGVVAAAAVAAVTWVVLDNYLDEQEANRPRYIPEEINSGKSVLPLLFPIEFAPQPSGPEVSPLPDTPELPTLPNDPEIPVVPSYPELPAPTAAEITYPALPDGPPDPTEFTITPALPLIPSPTVSPSELPMIPSFMPVIPIVPPAIVPLVPFTTGDPKTSDRHVSTGFLPRAQSGRGSEDSRRHPDEEIRDDAIRRVAETEVATELTDRADAATLAKIAEMLAEYGATPMTPPVPLSNSRIDKRPPIKVGDRRTILERIRDNQDLLGTVAAHIIAEGHLASSWGFWAVISKFSGAEGNIEPLIEEIRLGNALYHLGFEDLVFNLDKKIGDDDTWADGGETRPFYDIDVGILGPDGTVAFGFQVKKVGTVGAARNRLGDVLKQFKFAPAANKTGYFVVGQPSTEADASIVQKLSEAAERTKVAIVLQFSDGVTTVLPEGKQVLPYGQSI